MKEGFYGFISTLDTARGKNLWLRDYIRIIIKPNRKTDPNLGKQNIQDCGTNTKGVTYA